MCGQRRGWDVSKKDKGGSQATGPRGRLWDVLKEGKEGVEGVYYYIS
jgi:hypothetical protein